MCGKIANQLTLWSCRYHLVTLVTDQHSRVTGCWDSAETAQLPFLPLQKSTHNTSMWVHRPLHAKSTADDNGWWLSCWWLLWFLQLHSSQDYNCLPACSNTHLGQNNMQAQHCVCAYYAQWFLSVLQHLTCCILLELPTDATELYLDHTYPDSHYYNKSRMVIELWRRLCAPAC